MFDTFLKLEGIPGEATDDGHKDWVELIGWANEIIQPASATASSAGGGASERVDCGDFTIQKYLDKASPKLFEYCCTGKPITEVIVDCCRAGGDKMKYLEIKMLNVIVARVKPQADPNGDAGFPVEEVDFNYGAIVYTYTQQKREDGTGGGNVAGGWDVQANKVAS